MNSLTIDQIKTEYPDEWVLLGLDGENQSHIDHGEVLLHGKDYLELCYKSSEIPKTQLTTIIFTGTQNHNRKWLKATRLNEKPKTT